MTQGTESTPSSRSRHYAILDALRFVLALWVVMGHFGLPPFFAGADETNYLVRLLSHAYSSTVYGITAVMCFFVISGFCIHLPFRAGETLPVPRFYARRYIRIGIPVLAGVAIFRIAGNHQPLFGSNSMWWSSVLWSLLCEEIYYGFYPLMLWCRRKLGWKWLFAPIFLCSAAMTLTHVHRTTWGDFGPWQTAVILYPVWILGCLLAEQSKDLKPVKSPAEIWRWRFLVWVCAWICEMLNFKAGVYFPQTMVMFGFIAFLWLRKELSFQVERIEMGITTRILAAAGAWSYSLYLMHVPARDIFQRVKLPNFGPLVNWALSTVFIMAFSYIFYLIVERPSHRFARKVGAFQVKSGGSIPSKERSRPPRSQSEQRLIS